MDLKTPNVALKRLTDKLGMERERIHNFRHALASLEGVVVDGDVFTLSQHPGHSSIVTTTDMYRHLVSGAQRQLADRIGDALSAQQLAK